MKSSDAAKNIFINREGELRSGWRVIAFFLAFAICSIMLAGLISVAGAIFPPLGRLLIAPSETASTGAFISLSINQLISLAAALAASALCARMLERRSFASTGFKLHSGWVRDFVSGSVMGAATLAVAIAIAAMAGAVRFNEQTDSLALLVGGFLSLFFFFLIAASVEEALFRGFAFQALVHNLGAGAAIVITSVLFGLAHLATPNVSVFSTINVTLAGVWLGAAYLATRSLWLATGLHYSWNFVMVFVFGLPVSGWTTFSKMGWLDGESTAPVWLSGGSYGPEGGAAATVAVLVSTIVIWKSRLFAPAQEMLAALEHGRAEQQVADLRITERAENRQVEEIENRPQP